MRLEEENRRLREELGQRYQVIGESVPMKALRQQIALAAPTNGRVLIYGESGTGKELVARALHAAEPPRNEPFVEVNCAAIPEELIESELFGHIKGSFTGASEDKVGKISEGRQRHAFPRRSRRHEPAHASQGAARARRAARWSRSAPIRWPPCDVRVIAATNKKLEDKSRATLSAKIFSIAST